MRRKARSLSLKECYAILNLPRDAGLEDVKHAYRRRAFELHPDLNPDDPDASKNFQLLNEAYVALSAVLKAEEEERTAREKEPQREEKSSQDTQASQGSEEAKAEQKEQESAQQKKRTEAGQAYAEQDVLRDLLNDPFARRVFEDIYSELSKQQAKAQEKPKEEPKRVSPPPHQERISKPEQKPQKILRQPPKPQAQHKDQGVGGLVKSWFRRQIDDELTLYLPAQQLVCGRKLRLQISHGLSNEVHTIEVTLPKDFAVGKPIRLRGLGKHVGPWQGDLYLILKNK